jgi:hypothetical protein
MFKFSHFMIAIFALMLMGVQADAQKDALVLYFDFDENSGNTVKDRSGNGNDGTINGATWGKGKFRSALEFDGAKKGFVEVADSPTLNPDTEISYMAWFVSDAFDNTRGIISKYTGGGNQRSYNLRLHHTIKGALSTEVSANGAFQLGVSTTDVHSDAVLKDGQWHHAAISFKGGDFLRMYIDGELANESKAAATKTLFDNNTPLSIGTDFNDDATRFFDGSIDEVAIFNRALTEAEVQKAMDGNIAAVDAGGKLALTWGGLKRRSR